jgi:hypothetical protein
VGFILDAMRITENLQQKKYLFRLIWICSRFKKKMDQLYNSYPPELANLFFDTMTIQKTSKLLIDFSAVLLQIAWSNFTVFIPSLFYSILVYYFFSFYFLFFRFSLNPVWKQVWKNQNSNIKVAGWLQKLARNNYSFKWSSL